MNAPFPHKTTGSAIIEMARCLYSIDLGDEAACIMHLMACGYLSREINAFFDAAVDHARALKQASGVIS